MSNVDDFFVQIRCVKGNMIAILKAITDYGQILKVWDRTTEDEEE